MIYILLRIKLRNGKTKIIFAGFVKFTISKEKKAWKKNKKTRDVDSKHKIIKRDNKWQRETMSDSKWLFRLISFFSNKRVNYQ